MIITTRGIVLKTTKYRESSLIVKMFTEQEGVCSFIVNNVRSAKAKFKPGYFEALSLVEITAYYYPDRDINRLSEIKSAAPQHSVGQDIFKSSIIMFLSEILNKTIIEQDKNEPLFEFLFDALVAFDQVDQNNNFHLQFLLQLTSYLGFDTHNLDDFIIESPNKSFYEDPEHLSLLHSLNKTSFDTKILIENNLRSAILNDIIYFYQHHIGLGKLKSLDVLNTIFR